MTPDRALAAQDHAIRTGDAELRRAAYAALGLDSRVAMLPATPDQRACGEAAVRCWESALIEHVACCIEEYLDTTGRDAAYLRAVLERCDAALNGSGEDALLAEIRGDEQLAAWAGMSERRVRP